MIIAPTHTVQIRREAREAEEAPARLPIMSAARPSIEAKDSRKDQKVFFSFPREGDAAVLSGKAAKGCAVDRARPVKMSRKAARGPLEGFLFFCAQKRRGPRRSPAKRVRWGEDCARRRVSEANRPKGGSYVNRP